MNMEFKIIREHVTSRGGGVEIDLTPYGYRDEKMTAYQNYLGGGMLGKVCNDCTIRDWQNVVTDKDFDGNCSNELLTIAEELRKYLHSLTNPDTKGEGRTYEQNQLRPTSAY
jgi:hypothetical protein